MSYFLSFILFISSVDSFSSASRQLSLKTGASVTIPCHYDRQYIQHKKYWCYGGTFISCEIQAYANDTEGKVTVTDYPAESLFTVTMKNLQTGNTGGYWCAVEIGGSWFPDVNEDLYITVKSDPDLSVMESRVSGEEGGNVTVQCLYSAAYQNTQKQWCRFKDECDNSVGRTDTSQNSTAHISDDGRRSFSVQMRGLKKSDAGWYWCSAGDLQVPVHISVHDPPPGAVCQASRQFSLQTGASVTIPCRYDRQYIQHKKYWCYGRTFISCEIQAFANDTQGKVTVTDYPAESLFTVTINNLQTGNTGWYWCAVEIGGPWFPDVNEDLYITVKSDPDLSVMESRVRGEEGGSVTVQCLYSAAYQNTQKQWCRFKDGHCKAFRRTATSQNSAVHLSDDGRRSFSVQMRGLKKSDAGWYWCSAGDLQVPVHISVDGPPPGVTTAVTTTTHHVTTYTSVSKHNSAGSVTAVSSSGRETLIHWYLLALLLPVAILVIIICMLKKKCKNQIRTRERSNDTTVHTPTLTDEDSITYSTVAVSKPKSSASKDNEQDVIYSFVKIASKNKSPTLTDEDSITYSTVAVSKPKSSASKDNEQDVIYSFVKIASKNKSVSPNNVDDEAIYSNMVYQ